MNIGIDIRRVRGKMTGVGVYTSNLVEAFNRLESDHTFFYFLGDRSRTGIRASPAFEELVYKQVVTPFELASKKIDVFYVPNPPVSFLAPCPTVLTIHDVGFLGYAVGWKTRVMSSWMYRLSARRARYITTDSSYSKGDILKHLHVPESKVSVVYGASDPVFRPVDKVLSNNEVRNKFKVRNRYILAVPGTLTARKGVYTLLHAFSLLSDEIKRSHQLVIVGQKEGPQYSEFMGKVLEFSLQPSVIVTGYVAREMMPILYSGADVFVYPSQFEGFGLPPLESMACGTPVVASNATSIPEVVGDAGLLTDPFDVSAIAVAVNQVLTQPWLRDDLSRKGFNRTKEFSWDKAATDMLNLFERMMGKR